MEEGCAEADKDYQLLYVNVDTKRKTPASKKKAVDIGTSANLYSYAPKLIAGKKILSDYQDSHITCK